MMRKFVLFCVGVVFSVVSMSAATISVECDDVRANYYAQDNDWYIELFSGKDWKVVFDIVANPLVDNQSYTLSDMIASECYVQRSAPYAKADMQSAVYQQSVDGDGLLHIQATVTAMLDGELQTLEITYGAQSCSVDPAKPVYDVDFQATTMQDNTAMAGNYANVQFVGENPDGTRLMVCLRTKMIAGTYTWEDAYQVLCHFTTVEDGQSVTRDFCSLNAVVTPTEPEDGAEEGGYLCSVEGITTQGESVKARMNYVPQICAIPTMKDLVATNLQVADAREQYERIILRAHSRDVNFNLWLNINEIEGIYETNVLDTVYSTVRDNAIGAESMVTSCYVNVEPDTILADQYMVHGWVVTDACVKYILDLTYVRQEKTREETLLIEDADLTDATQMPGGWFQIKGYTEDQLRYVILTINTQSLAGTYTLDDVAYEFSYVVDVDENDILLPIDYYDLIDFSATVTVEDRAMTVVAEMLTHGVIQEQDVPLFHVTMSTTLPKGLKYDAEEDVEAELPTVWTDNSWFESEGCVRVLAFDLDEWEEAFMLMYVTDTVNGIPAGVYTISDSRETGTVLACPGAVNDEIQASFYGYVDMDGILQTPAWMMREGQVTVSYPQGELRIEVDAVNSCGNTIKLVLGQTDTAIEQAENEPQTRKYIQHGVMTIQRNGLHYNMLGGRIK